MLAELKETFGTMKTFDYKFRIEQLKNLLRGIEEMKDEICEAVTHDLGKDHFHAWLTEWLGLLG